MKTYEILQSKGSEVYSIEPDRTLGDVVSRLVEHNCGSLVVKDGENLVGIITERDILRTCASDPRNLSEIAVAERMSRKLTTGSPEDEVGTIMGLLTEKRIRHLPILEDGQLIGMISIGDVVKAQHNQLSMENEYLKTYIQS